MYIQCFGKCIECSKPKFVSLTIWTEIKYIKNSRNKIYPSIWYPRCCRPDPPAGWRQTPRRGRLCEEGAGPVDRPVAAAAAGPGRRSAEAGTQERDPRRPQGRGYIIRNILNSFGKNFCFLFLKLFSYTTDLEFYFRLFSSPFPRFFNV